MFLNVTKGKMSLGNASSTAFSPGNLSNLTLWYRADGTLFQDSAGTTPVTADGDPVGFITDYGSAAINLTQPTSVRRPTYKVNQINGKPALLCDGVDDWLEKTGTTATTFLNSTAITNFIVLNQNGAQANNGLIGWPSAGSPTNQFCCYATLADLIFLDYGDSSGADRLSVSQPGGWDNSWRLLSLYRSGVNANIYVNGTSIGSSSSFSGTMNLAVSDTLTIGRGGGTTFAGYIAEIILFARALSASEITQVHNYLNTKFAIY